MIKVNYQDRPWHEGLTVEKLLQQVRSENYEKSIIQGRVNVIHNSQFIDPEKYNETIINDGDEVRIYPAIAGG